MLLRNESRIRHSISVKLVFDDDRVRELEINEGDYIQISYKKNGHVACGVGTVRDIKTYVYTKKWPFCKRESAIITLDMSEDYKCCVDKIDMYDIIDVRQVQQFTDDEYECSSKPDFNVRSNKSMVGCPVTCKGVTVSD